jgi:hypothetical protein
MVLPSLPLLALLLTCALPVSSAQPGEFAKLVQKVPTACPKVCPKVCCQKTCQKDCPKVCPKVWEEPKGKARREMCKESPVNEGHKVETGKDAGAWFALCNVQDGLVMGPESEFEFLRRRCDEDGFVVRWLDLSIQWGIFRYFALPPPKDTKTVLLKVDSREIWVAPGEVQINTPGGWIKLYGTDAYIHVDRKSGATTLYVAEGVAVVEGTEQGERVLVEEDHWTQFRPGQPPLPPRPLPEPRPDGGGVRFPDDWDRPEPRWLDLGRLDLPKVGRP